MSAANAGKTARKTAKKPAARKKVAGSAAAAVTYSLSVCDRICAQIAEGKSLRTICDASDMPTVTTVMRWLGEEDKPAFREQYARAREAQADKMAEEIIAIADDGLNDTYVDDKGEKRTDQDVVARSRLRVDARKWYASKLSPKKYGDKIEAVHTGPNGGPVQHRVAIEFVTPGATE